MAPDSNVRLGASIVRWLSRPLPAFEQSRIDALAAAFVVVLALASALRGFDASLLISADALYPIQLLEFSLLDYRPPPPSRLFPDVAVHAVMGDLAGDLLAEKIVAGIILFTLTSIAIGLFKGVPVFTIVVVILAARGFEFLNTSFHYALPLLILLVQLARGSRSLEAAALAFAVFMDQLVLIPLGIMLADSEHRDRLLPRLAGLAVGFVLSALYAELGESFLNIAVVFPMWLLVLWAVERLGLLRPFSILVGAGLILLAFTGPVPERYALPAAASIVVLLTPVQAWAFNWRYLALPAALTAIFLATVDTSRSTRLSKDFDCLARTLRERSIEVVATDHWTSKPLYFSARALGQLLTIAQTDFAEGDSHLWMAPYDFYGQPTVWAVRNIDSCDRLLREPTYCRHADLAPVVSRETVCNNFELFRYSKAVPLHFVGRPKDKLESIERNLRNYAQKLRGRLGIGRPST